MKHSTSIYKLQNAFHVTVVEMLQIARKQYQWRAYAYNSYDTLHIFLFAHVCTPNFSKLDIEKQITTLKGCKCGPSGCHDGAMLCQGTVVETAKVGATKETRLFEGTFGLESQWPLLMHSAFHCEAVGI